MAVILLLAQLHRWTTAQCSAMLLLLSLLEQAPKNEGKWETDRSNLPAWLSLSSSVFRYSWTFLHTHKTTFISLESGLDIRKSCKYHLQGFGTYTQKASYCKSYEDQIPTSFGVLQTWWTTYYGKERFQKNRSIRTRPHCIAGHTETCN